METYYSSIFNEVFGPVMVGTSSSHTAGPYRIGATARMLLKGEIKKARISFDPGSSYASYYKLQWSDRGFTAGLLGIPIDSEGMTDALDIAVSKEVDMQFVIEPKENKEPNYAYLELVSTEGDALVLGTTSVGGGAIEIVEIDGCPILIKGDFNTLFLYINENVDGGQMASGIKELVKEDVRAKESRASGRRILYLETRAELTGEQLDAIRQMEGIENIRYTGHVLPVLSKFQYENIPFRTAKEALEYGEKMEITGAGELGIRYEMARSGYSREQVMDIMKNIVRVMRESVERGIHNMTGEKVGGLYPVKAAEMYRSMREGSIRTVDIGILSEIVCVAIGVLESVEIERPGAVVASPTVGSVGILPAAVVYLGDSLKLSDDEIATAMFAAGSVGTFVAHQATFGGEVAGCQAECGSAGAMAAAGVVEMMGGSAVQAYTAATITLQNILGQICDAVSVGYEPCNARNSLAVANALSTANMVLCGFSVQIPLDETIETMNRVGRQLPTCLKGTYGGLCCTPTGQWIAKVCEGCEGEESE